MRVLIAEDNLLERRMLETAIELLGHDCRSAADGAEAWRLYQDHGADVIISDWLMPGLDGQQLCQRVRAGARTTPYTYFLFLTMLDDKRHLAAGLQSGADDYLSKPFDLEDLAARLVVAERIKRLEEERLQLLATEHAARLQAEQAVRVRDQVLAAVSHDLKNPVAAIMGSAQVLQRRIAVMGLPGRAPLLEGLERIASSATRMAVWIQDLLDVTQLEMGQPLPLACEPTDLVALARQAATDQQGATGRHRFRVQSTLPALVGRLDAARLRRVLDNLLANAVKYSPGGGEVTVSLGTAEAEGRLWAILKVRDHGLGVPVEDQAHVFEPFRRAGNVGRIAGTGIGLAASRQIVELHGGTIELRSREGTGSTFTIRLPLDSTVQDNSEADVGRADPVGAGAGACAS